MTQANAPQSKAFWLSKTFWLNVVAALSLALPVVREWLDANPVPFVAAFAAAGVILRFVTHGKISLGVSEDGKASGGSGLLPLAFFFLCAGCLFLPSCSGEYPLTGSISYRDPETGAKGGLVFEPGKAPRASVRIPVYDEFGNIIGVGELSGPLAREIEATK